MNSPLKVKICGLTTPEAVRVAHEAGAGFIGLVFYPPSPRFASPEVAFELAQYAHSLKNGPKVVGLFVNVGYEDLAKAAQDYRLDYLQLAGDETPEDCRVATGLLPVIKSIRIPPQMSENEALELVAPFAELKNVTILLDSHKSGMYGGTGLRSDWAIAQAIARRYPVLLAGGLTPENVAEAVEAVKPWGVDVSSGVEQAGQPGLKDLTKIRLFIAQALQVKLAF